MKIFLTAIVMTTARAQSDLDSLRQSVPGEPGTDYPILAAIPDTDFSCQDKVFGGFYADPSLDCQGYHVCVTHPEDESLLVPVSFLCPNGTIFNQELFTCEWWFNVDCTLAESFYSKNEGLFSGGGAGGEGGSCPAVSPAPPGSCEGSVSTCWSPGQPDGDCPNFGLCCFDGCANTCPGGTPPPPRDPTPGYSYDAPASPLPVRPQQTTPPALYGAPRGGRRRNLS